jgi:hypothetical protein
MMGLSQVFCCEASGKLGQGVLKVVDQRVERVVKETSSHGVQRERIRSWRAREPAAEAKKAGDASEATLRTPRPLSVTGRLA